MDAKFSQRIKDVLSFSKEEAIRLGNNEIAPEHLLLGILREGEGVAIDILVSLGVNLYQLKKDIEAGKSKVKKDGFLIFNDYTYWSPCECMEYGVIQAVNELCREDDWKMIYFAFGYYMYCDVAIRRN